MSDLSIHLTTARRFILGGRACGMAWLDNYQERDYQSTQYFYDGDGQRVKKVGYQNVAAGRVPTSNGTLRWPYVVTNGDTWADSGMGESGEFAYTDETGLRYVQIDLGGVYTVDTIKVWHWANDGRTDHQTKTEVSADGVTGAATNGAGLGTYSQSFAYNETGNLINKASVTQWYSDTLHPHAVTHLNGSRQLWYDQNGNMTLRVEVSGTQRITYTQGWNIENRLTFVTATQGSAINVTQFVYDGDGQRVKRTASRGAQTISIGNYFEVQNPISSKDGACSGKTPAGATNWQPYLTNAIYLEVDTSACGFTTTPLYFSALGGADNHWTMKGATAIYAPTPTGFRIYLSYPGITPAWANAYGWYLTWQGIPANTTTPNTCARQTVSGSTNWQPYLTDAIYLDVDTSACGLSGTPLYFTSLGGTTDHWLAQGATAIYPTANGFRVYLTSLGITPALANSYGWHLNWLARTANATGTDVCAQQTTAGSTNWQAYTSNDLYLDVDTSACGFAQTPLYLTSLGGTTNHWTAKGATSIYLPTPTGFRVYLNYPGITPALANAYSWHLKWQAVPLVRTYYFAGSQRVAMRQGGWVTYFASDHLGSTSLTLDASGNKIGEMRYMPFGETRYIWGGTPTDRRYTGQQEQNGLGSLYDFNARLYSPGIMRFISPDTIVPDPADPQTLNRYAYARNSPLNYVDPSGHLPQDIIKQMFGLTTDAAWEEVLKIFQAGGALDGMWGLLDVLKEAEFGDTLLLMILQVSLAVQFLV
jgi:RHS repeat-associated protein